MDSDRNENNPFLKWMISGERFGSVYVPDNSVVSKLLQKWGINENDIEPPEYDFSEANSRYWAIRRAFIEYWKDSSMLIYDDVSKTVTINGITKIRVVERAFYYQDNFEDTENNEVRFVKGWIGTPALNIYMIRTLGGLRPNENNPFNEFKSKISFLPDVTYIPKLYQELGVQSFEDIRISGTGDWSKLWKGFRLILPLKKGSKSLVLRFEYENSADLVEILDGPPVETDTSSGIFYISRFPKEIIERLSFIMAQNREIAPISKWTKDPFVLLNRNLKGKDLIGLCLSNTKFNTFCEANDQILFKKRLLSEFDLDWNVKNYNFTPRELYVQMHIYFELVTFEVLNGGKIAYDLIPVKNKEPIRTPRPSETAIMKAVPHSDLIGPARLLALVFFPKYPETSFYISGGMSGVDSSSYTIFDIRVHEIPELAVAMGISLSGMNSLAFFALKKVAKPHLNFTNIDLNENEVIRKLFPLKEDREVVVLKSRWGWGNKIRN